MSVASPPAGAARPTTSRTSSRATAERLAGRGWLDESDYTRIEAQIEAQRLAPRVERALARGPRSERELFLLVAVDELSVGEAAQVLGINAVAARARLARARRRLRALAEERDARPDQSIPRVVEEAP